MKLIFKILAAFAIASVLLFSEVQAQNCQLRTQTMGGWGSKPNGNNPGKYLHNNFAAAFPSGLTVGCQTGYTLKFTSAQAISNFLPASGTPQKLTSSMVNPSGLKNTLAGQVTALSLSVGFDNYDPNFGASVPKLGNAIITSGLFSGMTVQQVLNEGNKVLGGCASSYSITALNTILTSINESFVDGTRANSTLLRCVAGCPAISLSFSKTDALCYGACAGTASVSVAGGDAPYTYAWSNNASAAQLLGLCSGAYSVTVTDKNGCEASGSVSITQPDDLILTTSASNVVDCANEPTICSQFDIMTLPHGTNVKTYFQSIGVNIAVIPGGPQSKDPVIYNSSGNWTEDPDLNLNFGNVIIINENPANGDGDGTGPDDSQNGGCLVFSFASPVTVNSFLFLDSEEDGGLATAYDQSNQVIATAPILNLGDASSQTVMMNAAGTARLEICYPKSGAVRLSLDCPQSPVCNGSAMVLASGGVPPYSYAWSNGKIINSVDSLCAGSYSVTVSDANACARVSTINIIETTCSEKRAQGEMAAQEAIEISKAEIQVYPNPIINEATLEFELSKPSHTTAEIVSVNGRRIELIFNGMVNAHETYQFTLRTENLANGIYFCVVSTEDKVYDIKLVVAK